MASHQAQRLPTSHSALTVQLPSRSSSSSSSSSPFRPASSASTSSLSAAPPAASSSAAAAAAAAASASNDVSLLSARILRNQAHAARVLRAQETLIEGVDSLEVFKSLLSLLNDVSYLSVLEERHLLSHCAYPLCHSPPSHAPRSDAEPTYRLAPRSRQILPDARLQPGGEWTYCGHRCWARSMWVRRWVLKAQEMGGETGELLEELEARGEVRLPPDEHTAGSKRGSGKEKEKMGRGQSSADASSAPAPTTTSSTTTTTRPCTEPHANAGAAASTSLPVSSPATRLRLRPARDSPAAQLFAPGFPPAPLSSSSSSSSSAGAGRASKTKAATRLPQPLPPAAPPSPSCPAPLAGPGAGKGKGKAINGALRIVERPPQRAVPASTSASAVEQQPVSSRAHDRGATSVSASASATAATAEPAAAAAAGRSAPASLSGNDRARAPRAAGVQQEAQVRAAEEATQLEGNSGEEEVEEEEEDEEIEALFEQMRLAREEERRDGRWEESGVRFVAAREGREEVGEEGEEEGGEE